jgi:uncharacterized protein (TIGR00725 family)
MRTPVIGVMGGANAPEDDQETARRLGRLIAQRGWILLNGGRNAGVMAASARGAREAGGMVIGILPDRDTRRASPDLDVAVVTGLGDGRNVINVLSSDVIIACLGATGTLSEIALALKNQKHVVCLGWSRLPGAKNLLRSIAPSPLVHFADTPEEAIRITQEMLSKGSA